MTNTSLRWGREYNDSRESEKRLQCILNDIKQNPVSEHPTAMDLGANTGFFSLGLADAGFRVAAVEPPSDKKMSYVGVTEYRHWVQEADDLPTGPFDVSLVLSVLHHIPRWCDVLDGVFARTNHLVYVEVPHPDEKHPKWFGSRESLAYLRKLPNAVQIGEHYESTHRLKRPLFRIEVL